MAEITESETKDEIIISHAKSEEAKCGLFDQHQKNRSAPII